ncbi:glycine zipper family protein [Flavobacterium sp. NST-5]|uniref:Glycine zipper family protein n=1 Tax=Flavobacterium ichthyis TaxID=2698827 RepID=A0ABW9ZCH1_9FLAO|nr:YMGG-like glycine zipper-containing protein [Flavobacterium ichthyis]NBL65022.1 glycine zipper family protein [Flavobacterium ichthyis]
MKKYLLLFAVAMAMTSCRDTAAENAALEQKMELDSIKAVMKAQEEEAAKQRTIDSMNALAQQREAQAARVAAASANTAPVTAEQKRKGWSNTAKGAVIGAGAGAITGAAVSKKKGQGAIIGGLAGAAVGAGTGAIIDDGKKKKNKE